MTDLASEFPHWAAVGLGSNLNDPGRMMDRALAELDALDHSEVLAVSPLHQSAPWGDTDQPDFLNAVVVLRTSLPPREFLAALVSIEGRLGKRPIRRWGPRAIDLDLLLHGSARIQGDSSLILPHPHITARPFVCHPLAQACEGLPVPGEWREFLALDEEGRKLDGETRRLEDHPGWPLRPVPRRHTLLSRSPEQTTQLGERLARAATDRLVVALNGPLGAGKSCLARGIARGLGIAGPVPSPTYTLCREYTTPRGPFLHWDFYRLEGQGDLESTAFPDQVSGPGIHVIEWAGLFPSEMPADRTVWVRLEPLAGEERRIEFRFPSSSLALRAALADPVAGGDA